MFSFFKSRRNAVEIIPTSAESPETHWYSLFGPADNTIIIDHIHKVIAQGERHMINRNAFIITNQLLRGIVYNNELITAFPYWKGNKSQECQTKTIYEWKDFHNLEAIIEAGHTSGCIINYFATDYAINKNVYQNNKDLSVNLVGLIYRLTNFDNTELTGSLGSALDEDFCGFFPGPTKDSIEFIGRISTLQEHSLHDIQGFMISLNITPDLSLDFFIAKVNVEIELALNKQVCGLAWIQGTLEK